MEEDLELQQMANLMKKIGVPVKGDEEKEVNDEEEAKSQITQDEPDGDSGLEAGEEESGVPGEGLVDGDSDDTDSDSDEELATSGGGGAAVGEENAKNNKDGFEIVPRDTFGKPLKKHLTVEELALATMMIKSQKARRDLYDAGWNRYSHNYDHGAPEWFLADERINMRAPRLASEEVVQDIKDSNVEINDRSIKKVAEAKARKKNRAMKKLVEARKKAEAISNMDISDREKASMMRQVYKKAQKERKKEVQYVVTKKGDKKKGKKMAAPGVKGPYKRVDRRMKADNRRAKNELKKKRKGPSRRKK